jgi:hypothetical protein
MPPLEDISEYFRVYAWQAGRVLTDADIADLQKVLADYNDNICDQKSTQHSIPKY